MSNPSKLPPWRNPKSKSEGDSLVLDILQFLESTEEDSIQRETALQKAFMLATYHPVGGITRQQRAGIMNVLSLYGREAIKPILYAVGDCPIVEVIDLAASFVCSYNKAKESSIGELVKTIRSEFTLLVKDAVEKDPTSTIWKNHELT